MLCRNEHGFTLVDKVCNLKEKLSTLRSLESWNRCTCTCTWRARGFHFLLIKCVLNCGVAHTWRRNSASLNYERFHGHQVKFKWVHFNPFRLKVGSKYTYSIHEALYKCRGPCTLVFATDATRKRYFSCNVWYMLWQLWNCTHFKHPTDEQLWHLHISSNNYCCCWKYPNYYLKSVPFKCIIFTSGNNLLKRIANINLEIIYKLIAPS